jgi:hypothetical protein
MVVLFIAEPLPALAQTQDMRLDREAVLQQLIDGKVVRLTAPGLGRRQGAGSAKNVLGMAGIGAIGGSLLGALVGAPIARWNRRLP